MAKPPLPMSPPLMSLAAQTDRFGSIGKVKEEKNVGSMNSVHSMERQCITMDMAVKEALMKGALMERVKSLENRLLQLCLELESRGMTLPDTPLFQAFKETSSTQRKSNITGSSSTPSLGCKPSRNQTKALTTSSQASLDKAKFKKKSDGEKKKAKKEADEPKKKAMRGEREKKAMIQRRKVKPSSCSCVF
ncbi:hypothetical protein V2J09_004658 [Rumex salicifolius]